MTAAELVQRLRERNRQFERKERFRGAAEYLEDKQGHCRETERLLNALMRQLGADNPPGAFRTGTIPSRNRLIRAETRNRRRVRMA